MPELLSHSVASGREDVMFVMLFVVILLALHFGVIVDSRFTVSLVLNLAHPEVFCTNIGLMFHAFVR